MGQGEMIDQLPPGVHVVNERYIRTSVLEENGKKQMYRTIRHAAAAHGNALRLSVYMIRALGHMIKADTAGQPLVAHDSGWRRTTERNL